LILLAVNEMDICIEVQFLGKRSSGAFIVIGKITVETARNRLQLSKRCARIWWLPHATYFMGEKMLFPL